MPTYRYRCSGCGDELEVWQSITADPITEHEACGGALQKVVSANAGSVLRRSGFYTTDSRAGNGSRRRSGDSGDRDSKDKDSKGSKDSESKSSTESKDSTDPGKSSSDSSSKRPSKGSDKSSTSSSSS